METVDLLKRVPLLRDIPREDLERIGRLSREKSVDAETNIVEIGDPGDALFLIVEGSAEVLYPGRTSDFVLATLSAGDFFGEMALLNSQPRSATVRAKSPVRALVVEKEDFHRMMLASPAVAVKLLELMSARIRNADEQISGLSEKITIDPLTGLFNQRAFHQRLQMEADRHIRYGDVFSLLILDVDHFDTVNEDFGHDTGDEVLAWVGRLLEEHTRSADVPFRVGGEEFAVLAPGADEETAGVLGRRLLTLVGEARPPLDLDLRVTLSVGHATCPTHGRQPHKLHHAADEALLAAKRGGRNRVEGADDRSEPPEG